MQEIQERAGRFASLHRREGAFVIPNPWDAGSARLLQASGFEALATTSAGFAFSQGKLDGEVTRDAVLAHLRQICAATDLPVSADLENGYGDSPDEVAETIRLAAQCGIVGASIEDVRKDGGASVYEVDLAVERIHAAAEAAKSLGFPFILTARADNYVAGRPDLADTIARLQAYQEAGAQVLFAPGVKSAEEIGAIVTSVDLPVNVMAGFPGFDLGVQDLAALGVKRVSVGASLARAALGCLLRAAQELRDTGTYGYARTALSATELKALFR